MKVVALQNDPAKSKQFFPYLQRAGRCEAIVEYVQAGSRLRVYVPKVHATRCVANSCAQLGAHAQLLCAYRRPACSHYYWAVSAVRVVRALDRVGRRRRR